MRSRRAGRRATASRPRERAPRLPIARGGLGEGGKRGARRLVERERGRRRVGGELRRGRRRRERQVDEGKGEHEGERDLIDAEAAGGGEVTEPLEERAILRPRVRGGEPPVGEDLLRDHAEPRVVRGGERRGERGLEAVEGRLHDIEDGLAVDPSLERTGER